MSMKEAGAIMVILLLVISGLALTITLIGDDDDQGNEKKVENGNENETAPLYTYRIINEYPHDTRAFTQGLVYENGTMYEGTGLLKKSSLRQVELETGNILKIMNLSDEYFGEGVTIFGDRIIQLTWQSNTGFAYNKSDFNQTGEFHYSTEGWGLTTDGEQLIMSDGTAKLHFLDPETYQEKRSVNVTDNGTAITRINELEYVNGEIYANIWLTDRIARISPETGEVLGWIDLTGILNATVNADVLNGIAYDMENDRLFVTGKYWPTIFEIEVVPVDETSG